MDETRLRRTLGHPDLGWLVDRVRRRMARDEPLRGAVRRAAASTGEREAIARLLGRPPGAGGSVSVDLDAVDRVLRSSGMAPGGLPEAVVALTGPVSSLGGARAAEEAAWRRAHEPLRDLAESSDRWRSWVGQAEATGLLRRLGGDPEGARVLADGAGRVLTRLPATGTSLAVLASESLGDAHGLDAGRPVGGLVGAALRFAFGEPSASRRTLWEAAGVAVDPLASTVLVHALPVTRTSAAGAAVASLQSLGSPLVLTLDQVTRFPLLPPELEPGTTVHVCENPSVVGAAAAAFGAESRPLVCLRGQPSAAALGLLDRLASAGARFRYHGDFDWGGIRIANTVFRRFGFDPWHYSAADYAARVRPIARPLGGTPVAAEWDGELADALRSHGRRLEEESVLDDLLADLAVRR